MILIVLKGRGELPLLPAQLDIPGSVQRRQQNEVNETASSASNTQ